MVAAAVTEATKDAVPRGFKQTEIGLIPEDWEVVALGDLGHFLKGAGIRRDQSSSGDIPCVRYGELYTFHQEVIANYQSFISPCIASGSTKILRGDILFAASGETKTEIGKCSAFVDEFEAYAGGDIVILRQSAASPIFMGYVLNSPSVVRQKSAKGQGDAVVHISSSALSTVQIPLPPLAEQEAIAGALSDADGAIRAVERALAKQRAVKQAALHALLTPTTRLPGFSGDWETKTLGELGSWFGGGTPSMARADYWEQGTIEWVSSADVRSGTISPELRKITASALGESSARLVPSGSILFVMRSGILRRFLPVAVTPREMAINQDIKALILSEFAHPEFVVQAIIWRGDDVIASCMKSGTTVESIELGWLKAYEISLPPLPEQRAIAAVLSDMDAAIAALEARRDKLKAVKQGMMQTLLTGKVRLE